MKFLDKDEPVSDIIWPGGKGGGGNKNDDDDDDDNWK